MREQSRIGFPSQESIPADPYYTPKKEELSVSIEVINVTFGLVFHVEERMKTTGFNISKEWTADEDGPMHVTYISRNNEELGIEDEREHPCARIVRRYRLTPSGHWQEIANIEFATTHSDPGSEDVIFRISARRGTVTLTDHGSTTRKQHSTTAVHICRWRFDSAMEEYLRGE